MIEKMAAADIARFKDIYDLLLFTIKSDPTGYGIQPTK